MDLKRNKLSRRGFIQAAGATAAAATLSRARTARAASQANRTLRWGMIGTGGQGRVEISCLLAQDDDVKPAALCDIRPEALAEALKLLPDQKVKTYDDYRRLLDDPDIDVVAVITPPYLHKEMTLAALQAGKHVYCEKPMAITPADLDEMVAASKRHKPLLQIGAERRYSPIIRKLVDIAHSGRVGPIRFLHGWYYNPHDYPHDKGKDWLFDVNKSGDVVVEMVVHQIDVYNWLFKTTPVRALASGGKNQFVDDPPGRSITDHFGFILEYPNARVSHSLVLYAPMYNGIRDQVICANGAVELDIYSGRFMEGVDPQKNKWQEVEWPDWNKNPEKVRKLNTWRRAEWASYRDFFACIREGRKPYCDAAMAREFGLTTMMIRKAMYEQRPVTWKEMVG